MLYSVGIDDGIIDNDDDRMLIRDDSSDRGTNAPTIDSMLASTHKVDTILRRQDVDLDTTRSTGEDCGGR